MKWQDFETAGEVNKYIESLENQLSEISNMIGYDDALSAKEKVRKLQDDFAEEENDHFNTRIVLYDAEEKSGRLKDALRQIEIRASIYHHFDIRDIARVALGDIAPPKQDEIGKLKDALKLLYDTQNGCPLPKYEKDWNEAMKLAESLIERSDSL